MRMFRKLLLPIIALAVAAFFLGKPAYDRYAGERALERGEALAQVGRFAQALPEFDTAVRLLPESPAALLHRANVYSFLGRIPEAERDFAAAIALAPRFLKGDDDPQMADLYYSRGLMYKRAARAEKAAQDFEKAIALDPELPDVYNSLAWIYATSANAKLLNGTRAVELAGNNAVQTPDALDTLAAAQARAGHFPQAIAAQEQAIKLAKDKELRTEYEQRLKLYRAGTPYTER